MPAAGETDPRTSDVGHWLGMTEGDGSPRAQSALGMTARGSGDEIAPPGAKEKI